MTKSSPFKDDDDDYDYDDNDDEEPLSVLEQGSFT